MIERTITTAGERAADGRTPVSRQYVTRKLKRRALRRHRWTPDQAAVSVTWSKEPQTLPRGEPVVRTGDRVVEHVYGPIATRPVRRAAGAEDRARQWRKINGG